MSYGAVGDTSSNPNGIEWALSPQSIVGRRGGRGRFLRLSILVVGAIAVFGALIASLYGSGSEESMLTEKLPKSSFNGIPMPHGVNVGSWLSLEDYFFASHSAVEVATPDGDTAGMCLPPLHTSQATGPEWNSETDLLTNLAKETSLANSLRVFHAHRTSFLDFDEDLTTLASLGIRSLRIPISWCLTDDDPTTIDPDDVKTTDLELEKRFTCEDPFYGPDVKWPAVPRGLIVDFLKACAKHGITATLDIHTYPGGSSPGTFSGVWPLWPRFWTHGDQPSDNADPEEDIGRNLWKDFVAWIETLAADEPEAFKGLQGLTPMNEPAHLAGVFIDGKDNNSAFLPPLPPDVADAYLNELYTDDDTLMQVPDGAHLRVFKWLGDSVDVFRKSSLPSLGKELMVNVIEYAIDDRNQTQMWSTSVIGAWWRAATSSKERSSWAVLDMHHYHAWSSDCSGASDGPPSANYTCSDTNARTEALERCTNWARLFRSTIDKECGPGAKLMAGEMSASTHHSVRHACNDKTTLKATYEMQHRAAQDANVNIFFWSFKMPYGGSFRPAWSLKHFLYLMGVLPRPDESNYICGDHVSPPHEPK